MTVRPLLRLAVGLSLVSFALFGNDKKPVVPAYVLRAQAVYVMMDPDAGSSPSAPLANQKARDDVEKALMKWGRFRLVQGTQTADLVIVVKKGSGKVAQPTVGGWPSNDPPVMVQPTDGGIRLGGRQGRPADAPQTPPRDTGPHPQVEVGSPDDVFTVYQAAGAGTLEQPPAWRYVNKDALKSPSVPAVAEFRKAIEEAEKQQKNKP